MPRNLSSPLTVAFCVQSGNGEKEKMNDLEACEPRHFHFYSGTKNKNKHAPQHPSLAETNSDWSLVGRPQWGMSHLTTRDDNSRLSWVIVVALSGGQWYGCARGKQAIVPKRGEGEGLEDGASR